MQLRRLRTYFFAHVPSQFRRFVTRPLAHLARQYRRRRLADCRIVAITGSFGKTTTTRTITYALGRPEAPVTGANGLHHAALRLLRTPPGTRSLVFEVGIGKKGQMRRFARMLEPDVAVVTSVGSEHARELGSKEGVRAEKAILLEHLRPNGLAVLNGDDPHVMWMRSRAGARVVTCGRAAHNDIRATAETYESPPPRMRVDVAMDQATVSIASQLVGESMTFPLLAALAVAREAGEPVATTVERLAATPAARRRMEPVPLVNGAWAIVDDRKALPETVAAAIASLDRLPARRKWAVIGDVAAVGMSPEDAYERTGTDVGRVFDRVVLTGTNKALRDLQARAVRDAGLSDDAVRTFDALGPAAEYLRNALEPGDVVLLKGRFANRMERIALKLQGRDVQCWIPACEVRVLQCPTCRLLTKRPAGA